MYCPKCGSELRRITEHSENELIMECSGCRKLWIAEMGDGWSKNEDVPASLFLKRLTKVRGG